MNLTFRQDGLLPDPSAVGRTVTGDESCLPEGAGYFVCLARVAPGRPAPAKNSAKRKTCSLS